MYSVGIAIVITLVCFVYFHASQLTSFDDTSNLYEHAVIQLAVLSKGDTVLWLYWIIMGVDYRKQSC